MRLLVYASQWIYRDRVGNEEAVKGLDDSDAKIRSEENCSVWAILLERLDGPCDSRKNEYWLFISQNLSDCLCP